MGIKEVINKFGQKQKDRKELIRQMDMQLQAEKLLEERTKSANQRELERYLKENQEKSIKNQLDIMRKQRENDINFNHNPINAKNITNHVDWEVMKEKNMFKGGNMFANQESIHKSNPNLFNNGGVLRS